MCYAIPGRVSDLLGKTAIVDYFGERRKAINELPDLKIGDYIYAQGGFVIQKVSEGEALDILEAWKEVFFDLRQTDLRLSRLEKTESNRLLDKAAEGKTLQKEELLQLLKTEDQGEQQQLFKVANFLRQKHLKNACCVHGILEFSNYCQNDCVYCGIGKSRKVQRYRMTEEEILSAVREAVDTYGFKALVLQSGEDPEFTVERLADLIKEIKQRLAVLLFVSVGEIGRKGLEKIFAAGARGLLLRFETSNPKLYEQLHNGDRLEDRLRDLKDAYEIGYLILTGGLIGLPGQTEEDLLNDVLLAKELKAEMYTFGPVLPHGPRTELVLKVLALSRIVDPENAKIVVTTGFETLDAGARRSGLLAGANSMMLNVTPLKYRGLYNIYPNRAHAAESMENQIKEAIDLLYSLGRAPTDLGIG
jgi:biotin synthase